MAGIHKEFIVAASAAKIWSALRDVGAIHERLARGFVTDTKLDGADVRIVSFANGLVAREQILTVDDEARRLAYSASSPRLTHHHASFQVFAETEQRSRVVWLADLLPNEIAPAIAEVMEQGCAAMKRTLEA